MSTAAGHPWSAAQRRTKRRHYAMTIQHSSGKFTSHVTVPEDVEVREESSPCFNCGDRGGCRHRPWMLS